MNKKVYKITLLKRAQEILQMIISTSHKRNYLRNSERKKEQKNYIRKTKHYM